MADSQLKIWRDDFLKYYGKTSLLARVLLGAAISFCIAWMVINKVLKPQQAELKALRAKIKGMENVQEAELVIDDLKFSQGKVSQRLMELKRQNQELAEVCGTLAKEETGKSLLEVRKLIDRHELRIVSEERLGSRPTSRSGSSSKGGNGRQTRVQLPLPSTMAVESHGFEVLGGFYQLRGFLSDAYNSGSLFFLNNIRLEQSNELLTDRELNQYKALRCTFEVHIPYRKTGDEAAGAQNKGGGK